MRKLSFLTFITVLIIAGCNPVNTKKMNHTNTHHSAQQDSSSGFAKVNGLNMYYEIHGTGTPLVLIHGGGSTIETTFGRIMPLLAANHKIIAVEMQAHGHTADIDRPLSFTQDADDIAALLKYLNIEKAAIFGFSNGASTTLQFAIRHQNMCSKIIVASTFYKKSGAPSWFWDMMSHPTFEGMPQIYKDVYLKINPDTAALRRMYDRDVARMQAFPEISDDEIKAIKVPAFIILGDKDVVTPEHALEMHRLIANSQLAILPGIHGEFMGEITTPQDTSVIASTASMIKKFLNDTTVMKQ